MVTNMISLLRLQKASRISGSPTLNWVSKLLVKLGFLAIKEATAATQNRAQQTTVTTSDPSHI